LDGTTYCETYQNDSDFYQAVHDSPGASFDSGNSGNIYANGQVVGTFTHTGGNSDTIGTSEDTILAPILAGGIAGGIKAGFQGIVGGLVGSGAKTAVGETAAAVSEQIVSGGTKQAVRDALENSGLSDAVKATVKSTLRRGAAGDSYTVKKLADGAVTVTREVAGRAGGRAVYEQTIDGATGMTKSVVQKAYDSAGSLVHVDPKFP
jgi:hypothetical protein